MTDMDLPIFYDNQSNKFILLKEALNLSNEIISHYLSSYNSYKQKIIEKRIEVNEEYSIFSNLPGYSKKNILKAVQEKSKFGQHIINIEEQAIRASLSFLNSNKNSTFVY